MIIERILQDRIVAIFRNVGAEDLIAVAETLVQEGICIMEVALSEPQALPALRALKAAMAGRGLLIGAGTVLTVELAEQALEAGADFLITPNVSPEVIKYAKERGVPILPGALTPTEVYTAMQLGADLVKIFPASSVGPGHIKALLGPFPNAKLVPTGGVSPENAAEYLKAGAVAVGVGGGLVNPQDLGGVREKARALVRTVRGA